MIFLATSNGVVAAEKSSTWKILYRSLEEREVTSIAALNGILLAGTRDGVFRSEDKGQTWNESSPGISQPYIRWLEAHPDQNGLVLAGTEPAGVYLSTDGGVTWQERVEVARLRDQHHWFLPYSPEAGCARGFAFHSNRAYTAIEVGGVLRSDDAGATWRLVDGSSGNPRLSGRQAPSVHPDVHSIAVHPSTPDLIFAPTGGGFYRSADAGATWEFLYDCYCRAAWIDPHDPAHIVLGPADGVSSYGRIEVTHDGGKSWMFASDGLAVPWRSNMIERFTETRAGLLAILSDGQLIGSLPDRLEWSEILPEEQGVNAVVEGTG